MTEVPRLAGFGRPKDAPRRRARSQRNRVASVWKRWLAEGRTGTGRQPARALARRGLAMGARPVRRHRKRLSVSYRCTVQTRKPKQDRARAERAGRIPEDLEAKEAAGELVLDDLDESGSSTTRPVGYR